MRTRIEDDGHFNATMATAADNNSEGNFMAMCHGVPLASTMEVVYQGVAIALPCWALDLTCAQGDHNDSNDDSPPMGHGAPRGGSLHENSHKFHEAQFREEGLHEVQYHAV